MVVDSAFSYLHFQLFLRSYSAIVNNTYIYIISDTKIIIIGEMCSFCAEIIQFMLKKKLFIFWQVKNWKVKWKFRKVYTNISNLGHRMLASASTWFMGLQRNWKKYVIAVWRMAGEFCSLGGLSFSH